MGQIRWAILTGEYPPASGGVGDYTHQLAEALAAAGDEVHVFVPPMALGDAVGNGVRLHPLPDHFGRRSLPYLGKTLKVLKPHRILLQYVPHMYRCRGMNVPFARWFAHLQHPCAMVMFHEVYVTMEGRRTFRRKLFSLVTRYMARIIAQRANRVFVSIPQWATLLESFGVSAGKMVVCPIFSNIPDHPDPAAVLACRRRLTPTSDSFVIGHFGTYGTAIAGLLETPLAAILSAHPQYIAVLLGKSSDLFARKFRSNHPAIAARLHATGLISGDRVAETIRACDVMIQPYPDGVSARRGTAMANLALGMPMVANVGALSEDYWKTADALLPAPLQEFPQAVAQLLANPVLRTQLGRRAQAFYTAHFHLSRTIESIRAPL